jgi:hypothetical protein
VAINLEPLFEKRGGRENYHRLGRPDPTEPERFAGEFPIVAAALFPLIGVKLEPDAPRIFEAGVVYYPKCVDKISLPAEFWRDQINRHTRDPDAEREGDLITSRFELSDADNALWPKVRRWASLPPEDPPPRVVVIVTALGARENTTVLNIEAVPQGGAAWVDTTVRVFSA